MKLRDPEECPRGHRSEKVVDSRKRKGYRRRLHRCAICGATWPTFQTTIDPRKIIYRNNDPSI